MKKHARHAALAISTAALTAGMLASAPQPASAQGLLDFLFKNNQAGHREIYAEPRRAPVEVREVPRQPVAPPKAPKISGPQYYTYKTDSLVRIDFSGIEIAPQALAKPARLDHGTVGTTRRTDDAEPASSAATRQRVSGQDFEGAVKAALDRADVRTPPSNSEYLRRFGLETPTKTQAEAELEIDVRPAPAPTIADALSGLAAYELYAEKAVAEAIVAHYSAHPQMIWVDEDEPAPAASEALAILAEAGRHGLDPADYAVSPPASADIEALARFEMALSARVLRYVRDVHGGRVDPNRISGYHHFEAKPFDPEAVLAELADSGEVSAFLRAKAPQNAHYRALQVELDALRALDDDEIVVAPGTFIRPGESDSELPKLLTLIERQADPAFLETHGATLTLHAGDELYSNELVPVIKAAQEARGLRPDGVVGPRTVAAIAGESKAARIAKVELALERLRWLPSEFGDRYVFLNASAASASYFENGHEALSMRTIVGDNDTQTYFFQDEITYVEFHPYWGVPRSIIVNKYLPKLYRDPAYFDKIGYEVTDQSGRRIPSAAIDWPRYGANIPFNVRQLPGPSNALGELKIMFPNKHAIYMHDTPDTHLFSRDNRALSNGCVRLEDPRAMAAAVLGWEREKVAARLEGSNSRSTLDESMPVYVAYFTAWPQESGEIGYFPDIYDRDVKLRAAIDRIEAVRAPAS